MRLIYENNHIPASGKYCDALVEDASNELFYVYDTQGTWTLITPPKEERKAEVVYGQVLPKFGVNYKNVRENWAKDIEYFNSIGLKYIRPQMRAIPIPWNSGDINNLESNAYWRDCSRVFSAAGIWVSYGGGPSTASTGGVITSALMDLYKTAAVAECTYLLAQGIELGDYQLGNELEPYLGPGFTVAAFNTKIKEIATAIKAIPGWTTPISYATDFEYGLAYGNPSDWYDNGLGDLDKLSLHPYGSVNPVTKEVTAYGFEYFQQMIDKFGDRVFISEFHISPGNDAINSLSPNQQSAVLIALLRNYVLIHDTIFLLYQYTETYNDRPTDDGYAALRPDGTFKPWWWVFFQPAEFASTDVAGNTGVVRSDSVSVGPMNDKKNMFMAGLVDTGDAIRGKIPSSVEYWNGSAWAAWTGSNMGNLLDGRVDTLVVINNAHAKFRFVVSGMSYKKEFALSVHKDWSDENYKAPYTLTIEKSSNGVAYSPYKTFTTTDPSFQDAFLGLTEGNSSYWRITVDYKNLLTVYDVLWRRLVVHTLDPVVGTQTIQPFGANGSLLRGDLILPSGANIAINSNTTLTDGAPLEIGGAAFRSNISTGGGDHIGLSTLTAADTGFTGSVYNLSRTSAGGSSNRNWVLGMKADANATGSTSINKLHAFYASPVHNTTGTTASISGVEVAPQITGLGSVTELSYYTGAAVGGGGRATTAYGIKLPALNAGSVSNYGIYINAISGGATNNYAIYTNAGLVRFGGNVSTTGSLTLGVALPVSSGGTGTATITGIIKGNGTGAMTAAIAGTDYIASSTVAKISQGTTAPSSPAVGDLWVDTN